MNPIAVGSPVPRATFKTIVDGQLTDRSSDDIFADRTVVVFALPGAFTPTCSASQVPGYNDYAALFAELGVDEIVCLSVNDAFVMAEWQRQQGAAGISMLADGNGDFARSMGMLVDKSELGFGPRSWRYSMLVRDGLIEQLFVEPQQPGDPYEVSDPETMLAYLEPAVQLPDQVAIISRPGCPHCARAKALLESAGIPFDEVTLGQGVSSRFIRATSGATATPQVFINGKNIGGADDLARYLDVAAAA